MPKNNKNPKPNEKVCFNCKHIAWLVGVGQGIKCALDRKNIPSKRHTCDKFESIRNQKNIL